eukprot:1897690-Rhodomonas_salina.3
MPVGWAAYPQRHHHHPPPPQQQQQQQHTNTNSTPKGTPIPAASALDSIRDSNSIVLKKTSNNTCSHALDDQHHPPCCLFDRRGAKASTPSTDVSNARSNASVKAEHAWMLLYSITACGLWCGP